MNGFGKIRLDYVVQLVAALCAAAWWSTPVAGSAIDSQANARPVLVGGRAAMLGGAYTAVADDASAGWYNPAGLAISGASRFDFSANAYKSTELEVKNPINEQPFLESSETTFPSFIGGALQLGDFAIGYSFITLDSRSVYQSQTFDDLSGTDTGVATYNRTNHESSTLINLGGSIAWKPSENFALGTSLHYYQRDIKATTHQLAEFLDGPVVSIDDSVQTLNTGVAVIVGSMLRLGDLSLGANIRVPRSISDNTNLRTDQVLYNPAATGQDAPRVTRWRTTYDPVNELNPRSVRLGAAWQPAKFFLVAADVLYHEGVISPYGNSGGADMQDTLNYSVGTELDFDLVTLRAGWFTNNSLYARPTPGEYNQPLSVDYVGTTAGIALRIGRYRGALGFVRQVGQGEAQVLSGDPAIQEVFGETTMFLIGGNIPTPL